MEQDRLLVWKGITSRGVPLPLVSSCSSHYHIHILHRSLPYVQLCHMVRKHSEPLLLSQVLNILVLTFISEAANSNAHRSQVAMHMKRWASWGLWQTRECLSCLNKQVLLGPTTYCYMEHRPTKAIFKRSQRPLSPIFECWHMHIHASQT